VYGVTQFLVVLYAVEVLLTDEKVTADLTEEQKRFAMLHRARLSFLIDRQLSSSVVHLKDESLKLFKEYANLLREAVEKSPDNAVLKRNLSLMLVEQAYC
jgi:hypothetical protein